MTLNPSSDPHPSVAIRPSEIHVWRASLDLCHFRQYEQILSTDELDRAARFRFNRDHRRFTAARLFLRSTLAAYLHLPPREVRFGYRVHGKPFLDEACNRDNLTFNLSHSHELAVMAVAREREIGIDIEYRRPGSGSDTLAERFFSDDEVREIRSLPAEFQERAFFACWTRKEAYIKARGEGLSIPLDQFVVSTCPGQQTALLSTAHDQSALLHWTVCELEIEDGYEAALAFEAPEKTVGIVYR